MVISNDVKVDHIFNDNNGIAFDTDPANMSEEETFGDINTFPNYDDPLENIDNHNVESTEQRDSPNFEIAELSSSHDTDKTPGAPMLSLQETNIKTETFTGSNTQAITVNENRSTDTLCNQDDTVQYESRVANEDRNPEQRRYNLRHKPITNYGPTLTGEDSDTDNKYDKNFSHEHKSTSSSSHIKLDEITASPKLKLAPKKPPPGRYPHGFFPCMAVGCEQAFAIEAAYQIHLKLHTPGKYPCNFCKHEETDIIKLGNHEYRKHSKIKSEPNAKQDRRRKPWACPRCLYQSSCTLDYDTHFAFTHFGIGDDPASPLLLFDPRKRKRGGYKSGDVKEKMAECKICHTKIREYKMQIHFNKFHDLTKIDAKDIQHCEDDNCSAYFLKRGQLYRHYSSEHNIEPRSVSKTAKVDAKTCAKRKISAKKVFTNCEICNKNVREEQKQYHFKTWHDTTNPNEIKKCTKEHCQAYFITNEQLNHHLDSKHAFRCRRCKRKFPNHITLYRHQREKHRHNVKSVPSMKTSEGQPITFRCTFCEFTTESPKTLALHEASKHSTPSEQDVSTRKQLKKHTCPRCPFEYKTEQSYLGHYLNNHLKILPVNCPDACKMCSSDKIYVENTNGHFNNFHNTDPLEDPTKVFKCDSTECHAYFLTSTQLHYHKTRVHPIVKCLKCVKTFKTRSHLLKHLRKCRKPYAVEDHPNLSVSCDNSTCTKMFHSRGEMKVHTLYAHPKNPKTPKEKNEICPKCDKRFISIKMLKLHLKMGHADTKLVCSECGKVFVRKHIFEKHLLFHKGPDAWEYQCSECGKKCVDKQKLEEHLRTHSKEKLFVCQFCGGKYAHRHNWRNHLKTKHADEKGIEEIVGSGKRGNYLSRKGSKKGECIIGTNVNTK